MKKLLLVLVCLIPFQERVYKLFKPLSASFAQVWNLPVYFEKNIDLYVMDFVIVLLLALSWKKISLWEKENKYLTLFLLLSLFSIVVSDLALYPLQYVRWLHLVLPASLFFVAKDCWSEKLTLAVVVVCVIEAGIAITQYFTQHSLGLKGLGEPTMMATHFVGPNFPMMEGKLWIFDSLFHIARGKDFVLRATGTLPHPNILGGIMVFGLLMTYELFQKNRLWFSLAVFVQVFCLFITYSRSALFVAVLVTLLWVLWKKKWGLGGVVAASFLTCLILFYPQIFQRGGVVSYTSVAAASDQVRLTLADVGLQLFQSHPFFGVGFNGYAAAFPGGISFNYIHNIFLHLIVEVGVLGTVPFLLFCFFVMKRGWESRSITPLCIFLAFLGIGLVDFYPICDQATRIILFLSGGWSVARVVVVDRDVCVA